jgi:hypothetical protein
VVRSGPNPDEDNAELVLGKGSEEEDLLSLTDKLRRVTGVHEVNSLLDGQAHSRN